MVAMLRQWIGDRRRRDRHPALPDRAWFDDVDAAAQVDQRASNDAEHQLLRSWVRDGYAIIEGLVPERLIDEMVTDLDAVFDAPAVDLDRLVVNDLELDGHRRPTTTVAELRRLDRSDRLAARDGSSWRIHGFFEHSSAADRIRELPDLRRVASLVLGVESHAHYSINFHNGSTQALHEDSAVFHLGVPNLICGAWIACEDIDDRSGPLVYLPGSHRRPAFSGFTDYPVTNLRTADAATSVAYQQHVDEAATQYEQQRFLARKGDVLLWHGMLVHGGSPILEPGRTRRSYVLHYIPAGVDVADRVIGPTNW
ncbi:MAG: hypothetical protein RLZZ01_813 [Actinomycetota bacterium]|jgi:ectoine hydroxylase-related dioxygenase (phytanoyl-CoA dioxygenase family)